MVYKAPDLGYHATLLTIPHSYKKKKKKKISTTTKKNNWTKTYTCTIASIWESLYDK